jgi:hypothetical protein
MAVSEVYCPCASIHINHLEIFIRWCILINKF